MFSSFARNKEARKSRDGFKDEGKFGLAKAFQISTKLKREANKL